MSKGQEPEAGSQSPWIPASHVPPVVGGMTRAQAMPGIQRPELGIGQAVPWGRENLFGSDGPEKAHGDIQSAGVSKLSNRNEDLRSYS